MSPPTIGLFAINSHACPPEAAARVAALAERLGYDSLWAGEHVVVPSPRVAPSPMEPDEPILDPLVALAHAAAHTERVRLGTGVVILTEDQPPAAQHVEARHLLGQHQRVALRHRRAAAARTGGTASCSAWARWPSSRS